MPGMTAIPEMANISELRQRQNQLLARLDAGPVLLTQHSKPAAVLVSPAQWNRLMDDLEDLEDTIIALKAELALASGEDELLDWGGVEAELDADIVQAAA